MQKASHKEKNLLQNLLYLPEKCNGECVWKDCEQHFEACTTLTSWRKVHKVHFFAVSLVGPARELL